MSKGSGELNCRAVVVWLKQVHGIRYGCELQGCFPCLVPGLIDTEVLGIRASLDYLNAIDTTIVIFLNVK